VFKATTSKEQSQKFSHGTTPPHLCNASNSNVNIKQPSTPPEEGEDQTENENKTFSREHKIIINNDFFSGVLNDDSLYQIHFESGQVKDRKNDFSNTSLYDKVLMNSDSLSNYFQEVLLNLSKMVKSVNNNEYLNHLIKFGFSDTLFDVMEETTPIIIFKDKEVPKMGDLTRFKNLETLEMNNTKLTSIHPSVFTLQNLEIMVVRDNRITSIPKEIGNLKSLKFLNLVGNKITDIPETIKYLDKSNGGNLYRLAVSVSDIGSDNYESLKKLLPNTQIIDSK
jgi:hypothetical protein